MSHFLSRFFLPLMLALTVFSCHGNMQRNTPSSKLPNELGPAGYRSVLTDTGNTPENPGGSAENGIEPALTELAISPSGRFLMKEDGAPFFWLSDTQWEIVHKSTRAQADEVLADRQAKGFTVIQIPLLFHWSITSPNKYGELPGGPGNWNETYWEHADYVIDSTIEHGMHPAIFPAWGNLSGGEDNVFSAEQAFSYGAWVANHYEDRAGVVYVVGGDRNPSKDCCGVNAAIAEGIKSVSPDRLVSFHSWYISRSEGHDQASWLDFSTMQTSHNQCNEANEYSNINSTIINEWNTSPHRPVINMEPRYENIDGGCGYRFNAAQTRISAYWSVFAGSCGIGYGQDPLWYWGQWGDNRPGYDFSQVRENLSAEFSSQIQYLKDLMLSRPFFSRLPAPELVGNINGLSATRGDGYIMVYAGQGQTFQVDTRSLEGKTMQGWWFNPRTGATEKIATLSGGGQQSFDPPGIPQSGNDWVLVLDDEARVFPRPGTHGPDRMKR